MKTYELTYLISSELSEEEAKELQTKIASLIQEKGGILVEEKALLKKKLAYSVKKQSQAFLAVIIFQLPELPKEVKGEEETDSLRLPEPLPEKLIDLEKKLKSENRILRYLILKELPLKKMKVARFLKKPEAEKIKKEKKVELEEIDKKLDEILE